MTDYIATFFSHFGATRFKRLCSRRGYPAKVMPVPRTLSSSCGTCVQYTTNANPVFSDHLDEIEQIVKITAPDQYQQVYRAEDI